MEKVQLEILHLVEGFSQNNTFNVVLREVNGQRTMMVVIGFTEAQAIAVSMDNIVTKRPLSHDLIHNFSKVFNIDLLEILITDLIEGVYHTSLVCKKGDFVVEIDSRTSDALALAVRFGCPIYIRKDLFETCSNQEKTTQTIEEFEEELEEDIRELMSDEVEKSETKSEYSENTIGELEDMLKHAIESEDYELAARIRDEINKRQ